MKLLQESSQRKDKLIKYVHTYHTHTHTHTHTYTLAFNACRSLGGRQGQGSELNRLKQELGHAQSQLQTHSQRERELRNELATLRQRFVSVLHTIALVLCVCVGEGVQLMGRNWLG